MVKKAEMEIEENVQRISENIRRAAARAGRKNAKVRIMGVCKGQPAERIRAAYACGIRLLGENRLQEAEVHQEQLGDLDVEWHFIGKLQKNKINRVLKRFQFIQSVDGVKALEHINKRIDTAQDFFVEINIGEEVSKSGFTEEGFKKALPYISTLARIRIRGLMTIPPLFQDAEKARPYFARMRALMEDINNQGWKNIDIQQLSMGMSDDYEVAVEEGATMVRLGTALYGRRLQ